jgi:hypothetical protein
MNKFTATFRIRLYWFGWGFIFLLLLAGSVVAQPKTDSLVIRLDSAKVEVREFSQRKLAPYLADESLQYDRMRPPETMSAWERFKLWLAEKVLRFLFRKETQVYWKWGIYTVCAIIICYVILKLTRTNLRSLFGGTSQKSVPGYEVSDENIHELDFEQLIEEAIARQHYSRAVRLFYLKSLKQLTDRQLIDWRINKTNQDYLSELRKNQVVPHIEPTFRQLTFLFEYICYGDFRVERADFEEVRTSFQQFYQEISNVKKVV